MSPESQSAAPTQTFFTVQALRGIAALLVIAHHTTIMASRLRPSYAWWPNGAVGVDIFFVISGLVLVLSSARLTGTPHPARTFAVRRLERIVPLYWIVTTLQLVLDFLVPAYTSVLYAGPRQVLGSYLFFPTYTAGPDNPILSVGWTMNYEMFFYFLFALVLLLRLRPTRVLAPLLVLLALAGAFTQHTHWGILLQLKPLLIEFAYGVLLGAAVLARKNSTRWLLSPAAAYFLAAAALAVVFTTQPHLHFPRFLIWGLPALALVTAAVTLEPILRPRLPRWLLLCGDASYSLYLIHQLILFAVSGLALHFAFIAPHTVVALSFLAFALCLVTGLLCYRFVEFPLLQFFAVRRRRAIVTP